MSHLSPDQAQWLLMLPEWLLLLAAIIVPFVGTTKGSRARSSLTTFLVVAAFAVVVWMLSGGPYGFLQYVYHGDAPAELLFLDTLEVSTFALFFKLVFLLVGVLVLLVSRDYLGEDAETAEYYVLTSLALLGMLVVAGARDLLTLFVGLETAALSSYVLAGYHRRDKRTTEAATKFFVIGSLSAAITLYGISLVYAVAGTIRFDEVATALAANDAPTVPLLLAVAFLVAGFGFKITSVPFHMWAPDVYDGAPTPVSALLSGASKKMGFVALFKVFFIALVAAKFQFDVLVGILAVLTMTVANVAALMQTRIKRILAWSSIAQAGYIMIALVVGTSFAVTGGLFHILTHAVMAGGAFVLVGILAARGIDDSLDSYRGLSKRAPFVSLAMAFLMFSLAGIPPLAGFASKFVLFGGAIDAGVAQNNNWFLFLAVAGIVNSAISLAYYVRVVRACYVDEPAPVADASTQQAAAAGATASPILLSTGAAFALAIVFVLTILMGVWPGPFIDFAQGAADSLLAAAAP